jgi:hypothetical protein
LELSHETRFIPLVCSHRLCPVVDAVFQLRQTRPARAAGPDSEDVDQDLQQFKKTNRARIDSRNQLLTVAAGVLRSAQSGSLRLRVVLQKAGHVAGQTGQGQEAIRACQEAGNAAREKGLIS